MLGKGGSRRHSDVSAEFSTPAMKRRVTWDKTVEVHHVTMNKKSRTNQRRRRHIGDCFKALFQSILIHAGCLSPDDNDELFFPGRHDSRGTSARQGGGSSSNNNSNSNSSNNFTLNDNNKSSQKHGDNANKVQSRRYRSAARDIYGTDIEETTSHLELSHKYSGAMFSLQNCTLHCNQCGNGETYWASFTERSFHRGHRFKLYRGVINGQGPQSGEKCVVKVFLQSPGTEDLCRTEVRRSEKLRKLARNFNQRTRRLEDRIRCPQTFWAQVDEVSKLKQLFFTGERKLLIGESVLFEPDIRIADDRPGKPRKVSRFMNTRGKQISQRSHSVLDAFVHYTYHITGGDLVACGFEGVADDEGFSLLSPVIHSKKQLYGEGDLGTAGIMNVFNNHICNRLCHDLTTPYIPQSPDTSIPVLVTRKEKEEEAADSGSMTSVFHQDSMHTSSSQSYHHHHHHHHQMGIPTVSTSKESQCTESMTQFLEPSAPYMPEFMRDEFLVPPPAYTQRRNEQVTDWLNQEETSNSFLRMCLNPTTLPLHSLPHTHTTGGCNFSVNPSLIATVTNNAFRRSSDMNANYSLSDQSVFIANPVSSYHPTNSLVEKHQLRQQPDLSAVSVTTVQADDVMEIRSTLSGRSSSYTPSSTMTSELTTARSEIAMETNSSSACSSPFLSSRGRQGSACSSRSVENTFYGDHLRLICQDSDNRNTTTLTLNGFSHEAPPTYEESEATHLNLDNNNT